MKKSLLLAVLFFLLVFTSTGKATDTFYGLQFGSPREAVLNLLSQKGASLNNALTDQKKIVVSNLTMGARQWEQASFYFNNNLLYKITMTTKAGSDSNPLELMQTLKSELETQHGPGKLIKSFSPPYKDGDGAELIALRRGYARLNCRWESSLSNNHRSSIDLSISKDLQLCLTFEDETAHQELLKEKQRTARYPGH